MKFYFSGYSDDVVLAGHDERSWDEHYAGHYLLSNGVTVRAEYGRDGWEIQCSDSAAILIPPADPDDAGEEHTDERLPEWLRQDAAPGYAPVLIIESDTQLEIVASSDGPFSDTSPEFIRAAKFANALARECDWEGEQIPHPSQVLDAMRKVGWMEGGAQ